MPSSRLVECQDCGNRWESTAGSPRCSKSDCGRSRNVEEVADEQPDDEDGQQGGEEGEGEEADQSPTDDPEPDSDDSSGGYTPAFESSQVRTDTDRQTPTSTTDDEDDDTDEQDADDGDGDDSTDEEPEGEGEIPDLDPEQLKPALEATFGMVAVDRGDHWKLDDEEAEKLAEGWCPVINHYAPVVLREYTELGAAAIITFTVIGPRLAEDREQARKAEAEAVDDEPTDTDTDTVDDAVDEQQPDTDTAAAPGGYASV